jgi:hypothetical protein
LKYAGRDLAFAIRRSTRRLGEIVTPVRATAAAALVAAVALAASQLMHFGEVAVGTAQYAAYPGLETVAQPPPVSTDSFSVGHGLLVLALAALAIAGVMLTLARRPRGAWLVVLAGAGGVAIALLSDLSKGLDEGAAALNYEGAKATLTEGFWVELMAGAVLALCGLLLLLHSRAKSGPPRKSRAPRRRPRPASRRRAPGAKA